MDHEQPNAVMVASGGFAAVLSVLLAAPGCDGPPVPFEPGEVAAEADTVAAAADGGVSNPNRQAPVCGPRCVEFLLEYYGHESDLVSLTREIQWPDLESGATLEALQQALSARGVQTYAIRVAPGARLRWPFPVLVHLGEMGGRHGHFIVWLPCSSKGEVRLWCGLDGIRTSSERQFAKQRSGAVLLTAPSPINDAGLAVEAVPMNRWWIPVGIIATVVSIPLLVVWSRKCCWRQDLCSALFQRRSKR